MRNLSLILMILQGGMSLWTGERRYKFNNKYEKLLARLNAVSNSQYGLYTDAEAMLIQEELELLLTVYHSELKAINETPSNTDT